MPDPIEYLKAVLAAIVASTTIFLGFRVLFQTRSRRMPETASVVAIACGILAGYSTLKFSWTWPPANALDRFLTIVLPAVLILELLAAIIGDCSPTDSSASRSNNHGRAHRTVHVLLWFARLSLCCGIGRILMHGSIYLSVASSNSGDTWFIQNMPGILLASALLLIAVWFALIRLAARSASTGPVLSLGLSMLCAGCTTMLAGYIKGGTAALPLATVLMVSALASNILMRKRFSSDDLSRHAFGTAAIGIGLVSLFSLLWIGRFFGQLTSTAAIVMFLTPLLCWITELPLIRTRSSALKFAMLLFAVMVPLTILLLNAKREFDEKMAPLL